MLLVDEYVEVKIVARNTKYYLGLGYELPCHINKYGKKVTTQGAMIKVKVKDLPENSNVKVKIKCDYCGEIFEDTLNNYRRHCNESIIKKDACGKCKHIKREESMLEKYGARHAMQLPHIREKTKQTCLEKYNAENPMSNKEIYSKMQNTMIERYGVTHPSQNKDLRDKMEQTNIERYGVPYVMQNEEFKKEYQRKIMDKYGVSSTLKLPEVKEKIRQSLISHYGYDNPMKSPEVQAKALETMYKNGNQKSSKQQQYICDLYKGELNYPFERFSLDIFNPQDGIVTEYNGSGHKLSVAYGTITEKEFNRKEIIRSSYIKKAGYFLLTIESEKDYLPSDEILLQMYSESLSYFNTTNHTWRTYDIDKGIFMDAEHKDGESYDFGNLRKIYKQTA